MAPDPVETLFERFRRAGDLVALTQLFDEVAPELLPLALRLAGARHDAEDLVQETFLVALEKNAEYDASRPLRPWLVGILVHEARRLRRNLARVIEPERVTAAPPPEPPEQAVESELRAAVESALGELPAKYSEVVSLHLFEGLAPREMSARLGVDAELVRTHLSRGLERLRRSLPASAGAAWSVADLGAVLPRIRGRVLERAHSLPIHVGAASTGVFALVVGVAASVVAVGALTAGVLWSVSRPASKVAEPAPEVAEAVTSPTQPVASDSALEIAPTPARKAAGEAQPETSPGLTIVRGRVLMPDGSGASGVTVALEGSPSTRELAWKYGVPKDWKNPPEVHTDQRGEFRFAVEPPRAFQWIVRAKQKGFVDVGWRWSGWIRGTEKDLGKALLQPSCAVTGTLARADGQPIGPRWTISASPTSSSQDPEVLDVSAGSQVDAQDGTFRIEGLPAGSVRLVASHEVGLHGCETVVMLASTNDASARLTWTGADPAHIVSVRTTDAWGTGVPMQGTSARLVDANGREHHPNEPLPRLYGPLEFESVPEGEWRLELDIPNFVKVTREAIHPGQSVHVELEGDASIRLTITDPEGKPIDHYDARLGLEVDRSRLPIRFAALDQASPAVRNLDAVPSGHSFQVEVAAEGFGAAKVKYDALSAGEARPVRIVLERTREIEVLALDSDGTTPLVGVEVELTRGKVAGHANGGDGNVFANGGEIPPRDFAARTGPDGRARFVGLAVDAWTARVLWSPWLWSDETVDLRADRVGTCKVAMPEHGYMRGKLLLAERAQPGEAIVLVSVEGAMRRGLGFGTPLPWSAVGKDGTFRLGPFVPGRVIFYLMRAPEPVTGSRKPVEIARVEIEAGEDTEADLDLRRQCTAHLELEVRVDGKLLPKPDVTVILLEPDNQWGTSDSALGDVDGTVLVPLAPETRQLVVLRNAGNWICRLPEVFKPGQCEKLQRKYDLRLTKGTVLVLDGSSHQPLRTQLVTWSMEVRDLAKDPAQEGRLVMSTGASGTTDSEGRLELTLPPGDLLFELRGPGEPRPLPLDPQEWGKPQGPFARLRWTDKGPAEPTITLQRP